MMDQQKKISLTLRFIRSSANKLKNYKCLTFYNMPLKRNFNKFYTKKRPKRDSVFNFSLPIDIHSYRTCYYPLLFMIYISKKNIVLTFLKLTPIQLAH